MGGTRLFDRHGPAGEGLFSDFIVNSNQIKKLTPSLFCVFHSSPPEDIVGTSFGRLAAPSYFPKASGVPKKEDDASRNHLVLVFGQEKAYVTFRTENPKKVLKKVRLRRRSGGLQPGAKLKHQLPENGNVVRIALPDGDPFSLTAFDVVPGSFCHSRENLWQLRTKVHNRGRLHHGAWRKMVRVRDETDLLKSID